MRKYQIYITVCFMELLIITGPANEALGQSIRGIWSGSVKMKQEYTGELGHSVLEITATFVANRGNGSIQFDAEWKSAFGVKKVTCSGSGNVELHELSMSAEDDNHYIYYIEFVPPDWTCSAQDENIPQGTTVTIGDKILARSVDEINILSGTQATTGETGTGPVTTTYSWHLTRSTVNDVELIVTPANYDTWLPEPGMTELSVGSVMNIALKLQARGGGPTTKKAKAFELRLSNTSKEPGITINYPIVPLDTTLPDLRFLVQSNAVIKDEKFQSLEINCPNGCQTSQAKLGSYDGGGWTVLTAEAILEDKSRIKGMLLVSGGEMDIRIPKRDPNSKIGEAWLIKYNKPGEMDDKEKSKDNKNDGDGLTAYEEYRGVISEGKFKRLLPDRKELGILAEQRDFTLFSQGIIWFKNASDLEVVRFDFDRNEIPGDGKLNANHKSAHDYEQYALYLLNGGIGGGGTVGIVYTKSAGPDIPAKVISVVADWTEIQRVYPIQVSTARPDQLKFTITDLLAQTVAHELGHAVNIWHHGRASSPYGDFIINDLSDNNRIFNRSGNLITNRPITITGIGDSTGTAESGDLSCMLNYYPYFKWGYTKGIDGANIFNQEPVIPLGKAFCKSNSGTGFNTTRLFFGKAARGNCLNQIKLR